MPEPIDPFVVRSLAKRGYLPRDVRVRDGVRESFPNTWSAPASPAVDPDRLREALLEIQRAYHLPKTGVPDADTVKFLATPHCSVPDRLRPAGMTAPGGRPWPTTNLTYQFQNWPSLSTMSAIRDLFVAAFAVWSAPTSLMFNEVSSAGMILIGFGRGDHGDDWPFEGSGGEYAHAFYPDWPSDLRGDMHFDLDENWSMADDPPIGTVDLLSVAIHEIGHALGLKHRSDVKSVMHPNYQGFARTLFSADRAAIQSLYA